MAARSSSPSFPSSPRSSPPGDPSPADPVTPPGVPVDDLLAGLRPPPRLGGRERLAAWWSDRFGVLVGASAGRSVAAVVGVVALGGVGWWLLRPPPAPIESVIPRAGGPGTDLAAGSPGDATTVDGAPVAAGSSGTGVVTTTSVPVEVVVQAAGAVVQPGVYRMPVDARVDDLVRRAGGLAPGADGDRVNLAAPLADGARVWIPRVGEEEIPPVVAGGGGGTGTGPRPAGSAPGVDPSDGGAPEVIDLNTADAAELDGLPGVGPATAAAILAYREEHGRFSSVDELLEVRGIGDAKLEQLRPLVRV